MLLLITVIVPIEVQWNYEFHIGAVYLQDTFTTYHQPDRG